MTTDDYTGDAFAPSLNDGSRAECCGYAQAIDQGVSDLRAAARGLLELGYPREELYAVLNEVVKAYDVARNIPAPIPPGCPL